MATWVTHLMIADNVLARLPGLDRHGFCVGSIAPDCNMENGDWTQFVPPREVTHWMGAERKTAADCNRFYTEYIAGRKREIAGQEERSFLLGYYTHLVADAEFQRYIRDPARVAAAWERIRGNAALAAGAEGLPADWDSVKKLIPKSERLKDIYTIEAEYLEKHRDSGYLTEILGLQFFPDYIDYLPPGAIVRKIGVMGYSPKKETGRYPFAAISREEYGTFVKKATELVVQSIADKWGKEW